ncbi:MFS transporter [Actinomadura viridis]|uniref:MFS transporter n=1 Tax=Actinomadura viridis TaxID=58110 RepID=UPI0036C463D9
MPLPGTARTSRRPGGAPRPVRLGLRENWPQFALLVVVNVAVGALVGLERTTVPLIGTDIFGLTSDLAVFSFIVAFGLTKALTNLAAGALTARFHRKHLLVAGWLIGVPVPFALAWAPSWTWIVAANVLLGINRGLTWSMTVNMKIDLVGPARRGLATFCTDPGLGLAAVGLIKGLYPLLWGIGQIPAGHLSDRIGRKPLIVTGMLVQAAGFVLALALVAGVLADALGLHATVIAAAVLTAASGLLAARWITGPPSRTPTGGRRRTVPPSDL